MTQPGIAPMRFEFLDLPKRETDALLFRPPHLVYISDSLVDLTTVLGVMKIGNIVPRAGIEPTFLAFRASVLLLHHIGSPMSPCLPVYAGPCLRRQCRLLHSSPWKCKPFNAYNYIHTGNGLIYTYTGWLQEPYSAQFVQDPGHGISVVSVMKMGSIDISGIPGQCATITPCGLSDVTTIPTPTCLCSSLPQRSVETTTL